MKIERILMRGLLAACVVLTPGSLLAQDTSTNAPKAEQGRVASRDTRFLNDAAQSNLMEEQLGRLVAEKSANASIKQFGQKLVQDHSAANQQLAQIAQNKSVTLPTQLDRRHERAIDRLKALSGNEFDRTFLRDTIRDHERDVREMERESKSGTDSQFKEYASTQLPIIQQHLSQARSLYSQARGPAIKEPAGIPVTPKGANQ
jgi:putative membrane protein